MTQISIEQILEDRKCILEWLDSKVGDDKPIGFLEAAAYIRELLEENKRYRKALKRIEKLTPSDTKMGFFSYKIQSRLDCAIIAIEALEPKGT